MYNYRRMSPDEQRAVLVYRSSMGFPLHEPPHFTVDSQLYLITAANFEHRRILATERRRDAFQALLLGSIASLADVRIYAWVILQNHYHLIVKGDLACIGAALGTLHRQTSAPWNREDGTPGRRVWYRFSNRGIRSEQALWAAINYAHENPIRHGCVDRIDAWHWSSFQLYLDDFGDERLRVLHQAYPALHYGKGWDWRDDERL
jgi:putative transposase